jgi:alpha-L-fucosidase
MMTLFHLFLTLLLSFKSSWAYEPTWESLDTRPLPQWYDDAKFGIFIHWGVFSVPSFKTEWFWQRWQGNKDPKFVEFVEKTEKPGFAYPDYASRFDAIFYEPDEWASLFAKAGAQYVVLTSKHHEGFCNWDSRDVPTTWNWNAMETGPRRDLVADLSVAIKNTTSLHTQKTLKFGLYHSMFEWFNPIYLQDQANNYTTRTFAETKALPELYDLVRKYEPELIWSDGAWQENSTYWKSTEFLAWYATHSTVAETAVWNDRWGHDVECKYGSFLNCHDRYRPTGLVPKKWENCFTIDSTSWGYNRQSTIDQYYTTKALIDLLIETVAFGGNLLLNVGPAADGTIHPIFADRLLAMGEWLSVNGEGIYGTKPWTVCQNETASSAFYTTKEGVLYAHFTEWPDSNILHLTRAVASQQTRITMLGLYDDDKVALNWQGGREVSPSSTTTTTTRDSRRLGNDDYIIMEQTGIQVSLPVLNPAKVPCQHAWVLALTNIANIDETQ